jgi:hypothetical protein
MSYSTPKKFDSNNSNWHPDDNVNRLFLNSILKHANNCLYVRGHFFLNEMYDLLGMERTSEGAVTGWLLGNANTEDAVLIKQIRNEDGSYDLSFNIDGSINEQIG